MKKLNKWLNEHYFLWQEDDREGIARMIAFVITVALFLVLGITRLAKLDTIIQIWAGLVTFASPAIAAVIALIKRQKWNPWYWFPILKGSVIGGLLSMAIVWLCREYLGF